VSVTQSVVTALIAIAQAIDVALHQGGLPVLVIGVWLWHVLVRRGRAGTK
jgi:hypothetical protein